VAPLLTRQTLSTNSHRRNLLERFIRCCDGNDLRVVFLVGLVDFGSYVI